MYAKCDRIEKNRPRCDKKTKTNKQKSMKERQGHYAPSGKMGLILVSSLRKAGLIKLSLCVKVPTTLNWPRFLRRLLLIKCPFQYAASMG